MKLNKTDYVLERTSDGGYYAWLTVSMQCNAYGDIDILKKEDRRSAGKTANGEGLYLKNVFY